MRKIYLLLFLLIVGACSNIDKGDVAFCPMQIDQSEIKKNMAKELLNGKVYYSLGIIGEVEPVYLKEMTSVFSARVDTGAETSSIDVKNIREFERDGQSWVAFDIENRKTEEKQNFERKISRKTSIKRQQGGDEKRITVKMEIKMGNQEFSKEFTLANREKFEYQVLIGRNILNGLAVVDVSSKNTLN